MYPLPTNYDKLTQRERRVVREQYVEQQQGYCYFCKGLLTKPSTIDKPVSPELFPSGFFNHPVHLHHCHKTGMTIGAVHAHCNAVLWEYHGE